MTLNFDYYLRNPIQLDDAPFIKISQFDLKNIRGKTIDKILGDFNLIKEGERNESFPRFIRTAAKVSQIIVGVLIGVVSLAFSPIRMPFLTPLAEKIVLYPKLLVIENVALVAFLIFGLANIYQEMALENKVKQAWKKSYQQELTELKAWYSNIQNHAEVCQNLLDEYKMLENPSQEAQNLAQQIEEAKERIENEDEKLFNLERTSAYYALVKELSN